MILSYPNEGEERLDKFLASRFSNYSRNYFRHLIESGDVLVNHLQRKPSHFLRKNDSLEINFVKFNDEINLKPFNIELDIIYEDKDIVAINKQAGLVVHPAAGNVDETLVNALIKRYPKITSAVFDKDSKMSRSRPGIVHRLDKDTSGVILVAKNKRALVSISKQIKNRTVRKIYWAICYGWPKENQGRIISFLGRNPKNRKVVTNLNPAVGKKAICVYRVMQYLVDHKNDRYSVVEFNLKTGRTHQIRYQAASLQLPILGDRVYGSKKSMKASDFHNVCRQMLHAKHIEFYLPGETKLTTLEAPLPQDMKSIIDSFDQASF